MKIYLLVLLLSLSNVGYTRVNKQIAIMSPEDRYQLFVSMKEAADAYKVNNRVVKADSFYRTALEIYPIGDEAHQLANQLNMILDDEQTFSNFMLVGEEAYNSKDYKKSLANYLMANRLDSHMELYQKISEGYKILGDTNNASYYEQLSQGTVMSNSMLYSTTPTVEPNTYTDYEEILNVDELNTLIEDDYNSQRN